MNRIIVSAAALKSVSNFSAVNDVRPQLNGVAVQWSGNGRIDYVATDGHILGCVRQHTGGPDSGSGSIVIGTDAVKAILKMAGKAEFITLDIESDEHANASVDNASFRFTLITGRAYPEWQILVVAEKFGTNDAAPNVCIQPHFFATIAAAAKPFAPSRHNSGALSLRLNGDRAIAWSVKGKDDNFTLAGVAMGLRDTPMMNDPCEGIR